MMKRLTNKDEYGNYIIGDINELGFELEFEDLNKVTNACNKLGQLEDLEQEMGIGIVELLSLPDKEIYSIDLIDKTVFVEKVITVVIEENHCYIFVDKKVGGERFPIRYLMVFNKLWFLTREAAEKKLEKIR